MGGRGPRGPTAEDIFVACPPLPPALGLAPFGFTPSSCAPVSPSQRSPPGGGGGRRSSGSGSGSSGAGDRASPVFHGCLHPPSPGCCLCFGRPSEARGCPAASRSPASAGGGGLAEARRARRGGEGSRLARPIPASRAGRGGRGRGRDPGWGRRRRRRGCSRARLPPVWGCGRGDGEFGCLLGGVSEAPLPGDAAALADTAAQSRSRSAHGHPPAHSPGPSHARPRRSPYARQRARHIALSPGTPRP